MVSNPEFLREGSAVEDFLNPDRIVVGSDHAAAAERVAGLGAPVVLTDAASAEMVKYAANCFLAMKLSYVNALAELCERLGANIVDVAAGMGYDRRIGTSFLRPGPGWGGSCLPQDTHALLAVADAAGVGFGLLKAVIWTTPGRRAGSPTRWRSPAGFPRQPVWTVSGSACSVSRSRRTRTICGRPRRWRWRKSSLGEAPNSPATTPVCSPAIPGAAPSAPFWRA